MAAFCGLLRYWCVDCESRRSTSSTKVSSLTRSSVSSVRQQPTVSVVCPPATQQPSSVVEVDAERRRKAVYEQRSSGANNGSTAADKEGRWSNNSRTKNASVEHPDNPAITTSSGRIDDESAVSSASQSTTPTLSMGGQRFDLRQPPPRSPLPSVDGVRAPFPPISSRHLGVHQAFVAVHSHVSTLIVPQLVRTKPTRYAVSLKKYVGSRTISPNEASTVTI